jgi:hypothetical protein
MKLRDNVTIFHYKYAKKIIGSFLEMLSDIMVGQLQSMPKPPINVAEKTIHN